LIAVCSKEQKEKVSIYHSALWRDGLSEKIQPKKKEPNDDRERNRLGYIVSYK